MSWRRRTVALTFAAALLPCSLLAQEPAPERIQIGLSTDVIRIGADFGGADLTIFGSIENIDPTVVRQGRYDVIVVLEGPARPITVRRKDRVLGIWMNTDSESFVNVPESYSIATTRPLQDITGQNSYRRLALGIDYVHTEPYEEDVSPATLQEFRAALRDRKKANGLYNQRIGGVQFLSSNLFRATVTLAPDVPVGTHKARAFLFRNGVFIDETYANLAILKSGFEQMLFRLSRNHSLFYGFVAVGLAMVTGWVGRLVFKRD
ncbi:TIGR02186 family protein [Pseudaminobacter sp. 19-2017]|uniref:TIGR02186 family protein n=1 Tax=Pseudaminobacter soli (ex Zhang et al. 2022) TaxID=2831468 RepID=A0A942I3J2_9HYPH|nr:TIGR02186 family protein [Pseudaminobacter soli]MBS3650029.1 TIGR02186 family protein [Pseudaminobacter soli]